jgi:hypothetical protein
MMNNIVFLSVRVFHVLLGASWLGAALFTSFFLIPALQEAGPAGGAVMIGLVRRKLPIFIASIAGLTVLTGLWLYWRFTDGFDPGISSTMGGRVFGTGGLLGLVSLIIAGSVVSRNMKSAVRLLTDAAAQPDGPARAAQMERAIACRGKAAVGARIVAILLVITIMLMAMGHYV